MPVACIHFCCGGSDFIPNELRERTPENAASNSRLIGFDLRSSAKSAAKSLVQNGTSSVVVALDLADPRSFAYLSDPGELYFSR